MKNFLGLMVLVLTTLSLSANALEINETKLVNGREVVGFFPNGAKFEYLELGRGELAELSYSKDGVKKVLARTSTFSFDVKYAMRATDGAALIRGGESGFYILTQDGVFEEVFPNSDRMHAPMVKAIRQNGASYVAIAAKYKKARGTDSTGEVYIVRLSDGAKIFVTGDMAKEMTIKDGQVTVGASSFNLDEKFEEERRKTQEKDAATEATLRRLGAVLDAVSSKTKLLPATTETAPAPFIERDFNFKNGAKLHIALKEGSQNVGKVEFVAADGTRTAVAEGKFVELPNEQNTLRDQKLVQITTEHEMLVVTESGEITRLEANYKQIDRRNGTFVSSSKAFVAEGKQYLMVSFSYGGGNDKARPGETFLVREDGQALRVDFKSYKYSADTVDHDVRDGILHRRGAYRLIDLRAFEAEARYNPSFVEDAEKAVEEVEKAYRDLTHDMATGAKPAFKAMDREALDAMREGFQMQEARSVVVLGESGTGKTELVRSFIQGMVNGEFPELPRTWRVFQFDPVTLNSGAQYVGVIEQRLQKVTEAGRAIPLFLFIDEIHSMRGIGTHSGNQNDVFQYIKTGLANGEIMVIGTSTVDEYNDAFKGDAALDRRINKVIKREPKGDEVHTAINSWTSKYKKAAPSRDVLEYAIRVAGEFNAEGAQPSKTIQLLEKVYATLAMAGRAKAAPSKADIDAAAQKLYQADPAQFNVLAMGKKLSGLEAQVNLKVAGHDSVKKTLFDLIRQAYAGTHDPSKPRVRYILAGPRGSGKTSLAFAIGEALGLPVRRFEMNTYREGDAPKLKGEIIEALRKNAFTILLFDEIEKAPTDVQQTLLGLLDSGIVSGTDKINTTSAGGTRSTKISALNAMILATTNAGASQVAAMTATSSKNPIGFGEKASGKAGGRMTIGSDSVKELLIGDGISAPLVDRFQGAGWADAATAEQFRDVIRMHLRIALEDVSTRLGIKVTLANESAFVDAMMASFRSGASNRKALELIQNSIRSVLAQARLEGLVTPEADVVLTFEDGTLRVAACAEILTGN